MRRWLVAVAASIATSSVGISINLATDLRTNVWAWAAVAILTLLAGTITAWALRPGAEHLGPHNLIAGNVSGTAVQARDISGPVTFSREAHTQDPDR